MFGATVVRETMYFISMSVILTMLLFGVAELKGAQFTLCML